MRGRLPGLQSRGAFPVLMAAAMVWTAESKMVCRLMAGYVLPEAFPRNSLTIIQ
jgi:hypothetical protein